MFRRIFTMIVIVAIATMLIESKMVAFEVKVLPRIASDACSYILVTIAPTDGIRSLYHYKRTVSYYDCVMADESHSTGLTTFVDDLNNNSER